LFSDFSISIFESIPEIYKHKKSWVKDVIQGFAQKAVNLLCSRARRPNATR